MKDCEILHVIRKKTMMRFSETNNIKSCGLAIIVCHKKTMRFSIGRVCKSEVSVNSTITSILNENII